MRSHGSAIHHSNISKGYWPALIVWFVTLIAVYFTSTRFAFIQMGPFEYSLVQYCIFPLLLLGAFFVRINNIGIPSQILFLAALGALISGLYAFRVPFLGHNPLLVARLDQDQFETQTYMVRARLDSFLKGSDVTPKRYYKQIETLPQAEQVAQRYNDQSMILWGRPLWQNLLVPDALARDFSPALLKQVEQDFQVKVVPHYSIVGIPGAPENATAQFLAALVSGMSAKTLSGKEIGITTAARLVHGWRLFSHRSYALFLLGNFHLARAVQQTPVTGADIQCALNAYQKGLDLIRSKDDPELIAAIYNNIGAALRIDSSLAGHKKSRLLARKKFKAAIAYVKYPARYVPADFVGAVTAQENLLLNKLKIKGTRDQSKKKRIKLQKNKKLLRPHKIHTTIHKENGSL